MLLEFLVDRKNLAQSLLAFIRTSDSFGQMNEFGVFIETGCGQQQIADVAGFLGLSLYLNLFALMRGFDVVIQIGGGTKLFVAGFAGPAVAAVRNFFVRAKVVFIEKSFAAVLALKRPQLFGK